MILAILVEDSALVEEKGSYRDLAHIAGWWRRAGWRRAGYDGFAKKRVFLPGAVRSAARGAWAPHPDRRGQGPTHPSPGTRRRRHAAGPGGLGRAADLRFLPGLRAIDPVRRFLAIPLSSLMSRYCRLDSSAGTQGTSEEAQQR